MKKSKCDICGKLYDYGQWCTSSVIWKNYDTGYIFPRSRDVEYDFCYDCTKKFSKLLSFMNK